MKSCRVTQVVKRRGESMAAAAKLGKPHGMLSVIGLDDAALESVCSKARAKVGSEAVCQIANYLFPTGRVVSGHKSALDEVRTPQPDPILYAGNLQRSWCCKTL